MQNQLCYSVKDAAAQLSMSRSKMFQLIKCGEVKSVKIDGKRLVPYSALNDLVERKLAEEAGD